MTRKQTTRCLRTIFALITCLPPASGMANPGPIAEVLCGPSDEMRQSLELQFAASLSWQGLRDPEQVVELWEDRQGDWTLVIAYASGRRCIVAMGTPLRGFADLPQG